jgi:hypothetical protein
MKDTLYQSIILLDQEQINHKRTSYNALDFMGDLGGVTELIMVLFGYFLIPIAEHSFLVKTIRAAFMAKTRD